MSFERHHPNQENDRNLTRARDLRSAYIVVPLLAILAFVARACRTGRDIGVPVRR